MQGAHDAQFSGCTLLHGADGNSGSDQFTGIDAPREAAERRLIEQDTAITGAFPAEGEGPVQQVAASLKYLTDVVAPTLG